jgi:outer membrane protein assembly factor BamB
VNDSDGTVLFDTTDPVGPFSRPAFYRKPIEGNFGTGKGNNQDILVWSYAPTPNATTAQTGSTFAFQLPFNYVADLGADLLSVTTLLATVGWRSTHPPRIAAGGFQMFWPVSRGQFRSWVNTRFNALSNGDAAFDRGYPAFLAPLSTPAVDNEMTPTILCAGGADSQFVCMNSANITLGAIWSVSVAGLILSDPIFSTEGDRVYFAQDRGAITAANPRTGDFFYEKSTGAPLASNFALSKDGSVLYYGDQIGNVVAWKVAEPVVFPTEAPTVAPTVTESEMPTVTGETVAPAVTSGPTAGPTTRSPRVEPTTRLPTAASPTVSPVARPTAPPTVSGASHVTSVVSVIAASILAAAVF